ncbi:MAG: hypothetical protein FWB98_03770 [Defluviitaleaceae bacterium]|nr:hypothetical protein [Defluviitaleaceae bacterium]
MREKLEIILCLVAGLSVTVVNIVLGRELTNVLFDLLISMVAFYIIGLIVKAVLRKIFPPATEEDELFSEYFLEDFEDTPGLDSVTAAEQISEQTPAPSSARPLQNDAAKSEAR